ncbi:hypothetical protein GQ457_15G005290 [Hibiscus cannabinus]
MLWHKRLGHPSFIYLSKLQPSLFVNKNPNSFHCDVCSMAKHTRKPYFPSTYKSSHPFSLVHSDIWGPSRVQNADHSKWFIMFIDDHTRLTWTYLMRVKSDALIIFETFYNMVFTQFNSRIQQFHSDNGREYFVHSLGSFFRKHGIVQLSSCVDTPQQNSIAERKNSHLLEVTRALLFSINVPHYLWGEVLLTATYLINRMPSKVLHFKSPQNLFLEFYPSFKPVSSILPLRVFGCTTFAHNVQPNRSKLDPRAVKCVFVGYSSSKKGYKVYHLPSKKFFSTMDLTFVEHESFFQPTPPQGELLSSSEVFSPLSLDPIPLPSSLPDPTLSSPNLPTPSPSPSLSDPPNQSSPSPLRSPTTASSTSKQPPSAAPPLLYGFHFAVCHVPRIGHGFSCPSSGEYCAK